MIPWQGVWRLGFALGVLLLATETASAARARFHFVPAGDSGRVVLQPVGPGAEGELVRWFGLGRPGVARLPRPNQLVTFRHPATGRTVIVPLTLFEGTPRMEYRGDRVIYNYGSDTVEVQFLADGSLDVIYNSGLLREL